MRIKLLCVSASLLLLAACEADSPTALSPSDAASAARRTSGTTTTPALGTPVQIVSAMSATLCTEAAGGGTTSVGQLTTASCGTSAGQRFTFEANNAIKTAGGLCLDVSGGYGRDGDAVIAFECNGDPNQQWRVSSRGELIGQNGKCLDIPGATTRLGVALVIWGCNGGANQRWNLVGTSGASPVTDSSVTAPAPTDTAVTPAPAPAPAPTPTAPAVRVGKYVAANGSSGGSGTIDSPLDLQTALNGGRVSPGDTVWVRGGTYRGQFVNWLDGTSSARITVRALPGERATIDGNLVIMGSNVTFWGLEVMSSNPVSTGQQGLNIKAPNSKFINLVVHDAGMSGIGLWTEAPSSEVYGSLVYNNGTHQNLDHGIYAQNDQGLKYITDNVIFDNWAYGLHIYSGTGGYIRNFDVQGNVSFNNGTSGPDRAAPDLFIGGDVIADGITFAANNTYRSDRAQSAWIGYDASRQNGSLVWKDNYIVGGLDLFNWSPLTNTGNTIIGGNGSGTRVVVRPNKYEAGRANVTVYNWANQGSVTVNLGGVLATGDNYVVKNVLDFYGAPVASGTFNGSSITIPITAYNPPATIGRSSYGLRSTGTQFNVYVVMRAGT